MNIRISRLSVVVLLVVATGCTRSAEGQLPTPEMISESLLTITEMPGDWNESQRQIFTEREPENPSIDPSIWCPAAKEVTKNLMKLAGTSGADVEMQKEATSGPSSMMRLQAWSNNDVNAYFRDAREAVRICDGTTSTDEVGVVSIAEVIEGRDIGDESISWQQRVTPPSALQEGKFGTTSRTTIARFGDILMVLQIGDVQLETVKAMTEDEWWSIVELAGRKLDELSEQVHD